MERNREYRSLWTPRSNLIRSSGMSGYVRRLHHHLYLKALRLLLLCSFIWWPKRHRKLSGSVNNRPSSNTNLHECIHFSFPHKSSPGFSVVEEPQRGVGEHHIMFIGCLNTLFIHDTPTRCSKVPDTTLPCTMDVVREWEERIAGACHAIKLRRELLSFLIRQRGRYFLKLTFKLQLFTALEDFAAHKQVDRVRFFSAFDSLFEWECEHAGVMPEPPEVGFGACKSGTVDPGLLTCAETDYCAVFGVPDTVRLGILNSKGGDKKISQGLLG